ncbi:oxidoreductase [Acidicapsa dinghuensis]|uniref:Oxidoreductase n=1 Tax=Acidicapsa dinghuensis TaxID=2218256 RepID=A0ABW1EIC9_9BACT|nr:oxidoreductase [Acidicapsa dinghuensis]
MEGNQKTIQVGLIGYGYAGKTFHAPLIRTVSGLELTVVGSSRRDTVQADLPGVAICPPTEVTSHPDVDLVVVATPNDSHEPLATAAMRAGKHVVVDKPFTVTLDEARSLVQVAKEEKRLLSVFQNRRWYSEVLATREILESGRLGHVSHYECHMDRFRPNVRKRWREEPGPGAGLWFDLGPHLIDQSLHLFGMPDSVQASFAILREGGQTDDWAHIQLNYKALRVILHASLLVSGGGPRSILHGTVASWAKYGGDPQEAQLIAGMLPTDPGYGVDNDPGVLFDGATGAKTEIAVPLGDQRPYYAGVRDAILNGKPAPISGEHGVAIMAILLATFAAGREGRVMPIPLTEEERSAWIASASPVVRGA